MSTAWEKTLVSHDRSTIHTYFLYGCMAVSTIQPYLRCSQLTTVQTPRSAEGYRIGWTIKLKKKKKNVQ